MSRMRRHRLAACVVTAVVALAAAGCTARPEGDVVVLDFWAMGREGEVVAQLMPAFERENPGIRVRVQQMPWTAAHEKLLTAYVGEATPDLCQLGNTWIPEFAALRALEPLGAWVGRSDVVAPADYFAGIWDTNVLDGRVYGVPWYVDTRVLFYRKDVLARAGFDRPPETWAEWRTAMERTKALADPGDYAVLLPTNEWAQPIILGMQAGARFLRDDGRYGAFRSPAFREAFSFYVDLFRDGLAPPISQNQVGNLYQEFARGYFSMYVSGPWNLGEFSRRLPPELQDDWATAPLPAPGGLEATASLAGGSSLVLFEASEHKAEAWRLVEYLSRPETQVRFYELTGNLPAREEAWEHPLLRQNPHAAAFRAQLRHTVAMPKVPEWERISQLVAEHAQTAIQGQRTIDEALTALDRDVDRVLEKRRWLLEHHAP